MSRQNHWNRVWTKYRENEVGWFQVEPRLSLDLVRRHAVDQEARILDVGGGSSRLVDALLEAGFEHVGVLDIARPALEVARRRLGSRSSSVEWIVNDITVYDPSRPWDVWHDRAVFHFLTEADDRKSYLQALRGSLAPEGVVVMATFGPEGPERCSGLDVMRYGPEALQETFGSDFRLQESHFEIHRTPDGQDQQYTYCVFHRQGSTNA